jgi:hypothetical protein
VALPKRSKRELQRQRCKLCWHADGFDFHVPDELWKAVVPKRFRASIVCLACFDELAADAGVDYAPRLGSLYFAGLTAGLRFGLER